MLYVEVTECCYIQHHDEAETETAGETLRVHVVRLSHVVVFPLATFIMAAGEENTVFLRAQTLQLLHIKDP